MSTRARMDNSAGDRRSETFLGRAFELARPHHPHPNPRVGCVIVAPDGAVVGEGAHHRPGEPHAEIHALTAAGAAAEGATAYVTLEPCSHHGRTPPCVDALIAAGIAEVVVAVEDPDPRVSGRGITALREAGVTVLENAAVERGKELDPAYFHHRGTGLPLVTLKLAATLDGQVAAADGTSQWITGEDARAAAHRMRAGADAVVVGAGTLRQDDPRLDVRLADHDGHQPRPVVIAGTQPLPAAAALYERDPLVYRHEVRGDEPTGLEVVPVGGSGTADLTAVVKDLAMRGLFDVIVEGGPRLAAGMLADGLVDRIVVFFGARLAGGIGLPALAGVWSTLGDATDVAIDGVRLVGGDVMVQGSVVR